MQMKKKYKNKVPNITNCDVELNIHTFKRWIFKTKKQKIDKEKK